MPINPLTWLEEEEIKTNTLAWPSPVTTDLKGQLSTGFSPLKANVSKAPEVPDPSLLWGQGLWQAGIEPLQATEVKTDIPDPTWIIDIKPVEEIKPIEDEIIDWREVKTVTWIEEVDVWLAKTREEKAKAIQDTHDSFNIAKWEFEKNKWFYTNFDETNTVFEWVLKDLRDKQTEVWQDLTDEQIQIIANKFWITVDEVKNPQSIFDKLILTPEGETKFWVTSAKDSITKLETDLQRKKDDLAFQLEWTVTSLNNQIDDVRKQLKRNVDFATAQGAFTGGLRSSAFTQGIQNIKDDWQETIGRLQTLLSRVKSADAENVARLTADYNKAITTAKESLDTQLETLKFDTWLQLSWLEGKFGIWSEELTKALNKINDEFWTKSLKVFNDYLTNMRAIQTITNENIIQQDKINTINETRAGKRFNELIANDGLLLQNTSVSSLMNNVNRGELSVEKMKDLQNIMLSSITSTLWQFWTVWQADLTTIQSLLAQGKTPSEIVAQMQGLGKFSTKGVTWKDKFLNVWGRLFDVTTESFVDEVDGQKIDKTFKVWDNTIVQFEDWTQKTFDGKWNEIVDTWVTSDVVITQNYWDTSPLAIDNVKLADWTIWTPWIDIDWFNWEALNSPISWTVFEITESKTGLWNSIQIEDAQGNLHFFNHLQWFDVQKWDTINNWDLIGKIWFTWSVIPWKNWDWSHLDYRVKNRGWEWVNPNQFLWVDKDKFKDDSKSWVTQKDKFQYADTLTASWRTKYLQEENIENEYIKYRSSQASNTSDISDIQEMWDIVFPEDIKDFKSKSFGFGNRMDTSDDMIRAMEEKFKDSWALTELLAPRWDFTPNFLKSNDRQQFEQAQRNFVNAVLRQESGAVIADSEFDNAAKQYFPATWDTEDTIEQKRANREQVIQNMYRSSWRDEKWRNIVDIYKRLKSKDKIEWWWKLTPSEAQEKLQELWSPSLWAVWAWIWAWLWFSQQNEFDTLFE